MDRFFTSLPKSLSPNSPLPSPSASSDQDTFSNNLDRNADRDRDRNGNGDRRRGETKGDVVPLAPASESEGDIVKNLPKGVVLGKDGKP